VIKILLLIIAMWDIRCNNFNRRYNCWRKIETKEIIIC